MNENQYVKNINGYVIKDSGARNLIEQYGRMLGIVNEEVTVIENNYFDNRKIYEVNITHTPASNDVELITETLPSGYHPNNTRLIYYYETHNTGSNPNTPTRRFDTNNLGISIYENNTEGHEVPCQLQIGFQGNINQEYVLTFGLLKIETENEGE